MFGASYLSSNEYKNFKRQMSYEINALTHKPLESVSTSGSYKMNRGNIHAPSRQGYERSHIFSWEVLNSMNQQRKGRPLDESSERAPRLKIGWIVMITSGYKTSKGNRGTDYWYSDSASDARILESYQNPNIPLNDWDKARAQRQYDSMMNSNIDTAD